MPDKRNGFVTTTADEQYQRGLEAGRAERDRLAFLYGDQERTDLRRTFAEQIEARVKFDRQMAESQSRPTFAQFHLGRIAGITEVTR